MNVNPFDYIVEEVVLRVERRSIDYLVEEAAKLVLYPSSYRSVERGFHIYNTTEHDCLEISKKLIEYIKKAGISFCVVEYYELDKVLDLPIVYIIQDIFSSLDPVLAEKEGFYCIDVGGYLGY